MTSPRRILIAASGSGGHILPAVFIARKLRKISSSHSILFVGSGRPLEEKLIDENGFERVVIPVKGVQSRSLIAVARMLLSLPGAFIRTWRLFKVFRPQVVIGVGGYVSVMPVIVAALRGIPSWIHEAEARAGVANRFLAFFSTRISLAFEDAEIPCKRKTVFTGHPVRDELIAVAEDNVIADRPTHLLVVGGSQGARALDKALGALASFLKARGIEVWHQCRAEDKPELDMAYSKASLSVQTASFIEDMSAAYRWAHIIISRSGAGSVMELGIVGRPCILVPFPFSQGGHQKSNAMILVRQGKALICEEGEGFEDRLRAAILELLNPEIWREMLERSSDRRALGAALAIAAGSLDLVKD